MRLNNLRERSAIPVRVVLIAPDSAAAETAAADMGLAMSHAVMDPARYGMIARRLGVGAPFFIVMRGGWPQLVLGNIAPRAAVRSLTSHLEQLGVD